MNSNRVRKSTKEDDFDIPRNVGVDLSVVMDKPMVDPRFERQSVNRQPAQSTSSQSSSSNVPKSTSSTYDAFIRLSAGVEGRSLYHKINDSNRPTWESYKKDNESKLDLVGAEVRNMVEYRKQLDREREERLNKISKKRKVGDSDRESNEDLSSSSSSSNDNDDEIDSDKDEGDNDGNQMRRKKDRKHHSGKSKKDKKSKKHRHKSSKKSHD